jgi:leucyl aminopeptidase
MIPTSTDVTIQLSPRTPSDAEAVVVFLTDDTKDVPEMPGISATERAAIRRLFASGVAKGKAKEVVFDVVESGKGKFRRVIVAGLGKPEKVTAESIRQSAGAVTRALRKHRLTRAAVVPPMLGAVEPMVGADAVVTGMLLASFDSREYKGTAAKKKDDDANDKPRRLELTIVGDARELRDTVNRARIIAEGQNFARTIASRPGNDINPPTLAKVAQDLAREVGLDVRVLDEKQMAKLGMGGILAVGAGSNATPPRMIVLEWNGGGRSPVGATPDFGELSRVASPVARHPRDFARSRHLHDTRPAPAVAA